MGGGNTRSRGAYCGLCTRCFNEAKNIMDSASVTTDQSNRLSQIFTLKQKRLSKVQTMKSQIHFILQVN